MKPSMDRKWIPKSEKDKTTSSNSSSNTENASNRITRAINKAVSTILPSSSNKPSLKSTNNNPPPGLSSILSKPSLTVYSNSTLKRATGSSSSSQVRENQTYRPKSPNPNPNPNSRVNPVLRTNLLTTTPTFSGVTSSQLTSNSRNKRVTCPAGPVLHNTLPTNVNYDNKGKRVISTRFATNSFTYSQVTEKSNSASQTYAGKSFRVGKISPTRFPGNPSFTGFSNTKSLSLKDGHKAETNSTNNSSVKVTITDPKGKGIANNDEQSAAKKYPNFSPMESANPSEKAPLNSKLESTYKNYEDWLKNRSVSSSGMTRSQLIEPVLVGERCQLCSLDLAFLPILSSSGRPLDPPVVAVLPCGHCSHESCLERVFGSLVEPKCFACVTAGSSANRRI